MTNLVFNPDDFFKASSIKYNELFFAINTLSGNGILIQDDNGKESLLNGNVDNAQLGQALLDTLAMSRTVLPQDDMDLYDYEKGAERYLNWVSRLQEFVGSKTKTKLFRPMLSLTIFQQNGTIFIQPSKQEKPEAWGEMKECDMVRVSEDSSNEEIGRAVRLALTKCKSIFLK